MSVCLLALCISLSGDPVQDRWLSEDKFMHFFASFAATTMAAASARTLGADASTSVWIGAGVGMGLGVAKEVRDLYHPAGHPSWRDLAWDAAGVGAGAWVASQAR